MKGQAQIPKVIHQIWIGPKAPSGLFRFRAPVRRTGGARARAPNGGGGPTAPGGAKGRRVGTDGRAEVVFEGGEDGHVYYSPIGIQSYRTSEATTGPDNGAY